MPGRRDIDDMDSFFEADEAAERQRQHDEARAESIAAAEAAAQQEEAEREARRKSAAELSARASEAAALAEYCAAGVEPFRSPNGMLTSLPLLRKLGWTIQEIDGKPTLVKPKEATV